MKIAIKKTPVFFLSLIIIPLSIFGAIYFTFIDNKGGMALAGTLCFVILILNIITLLIEQNIINKDFNITKVWFTEILIIILIILYLYFFG